MLALPAVLLQVRAPVQVQVALAGFDRPPHRHQLLPTWLVAKPALPLGLGGGRRVQVLVQVLVQVRAWVQGL